MNSRGTKITAATILAITGLFFGASSLTEETSKQKAASFLQAGERGIADGEQMQSQGKNALAKKVLQISASGTMKEARYKESKKGGGGQQVDRNSGNPFPSNTAYHSFVRTTCLEWEDPGERKNCKAGRDLAPYITPHGLTQGDDASGLEALVVKAYQAASQGGKDDGQSPSYKIWDVQARNGESYIDEMTGAFRSDRVKDWRIKEPIRKQIEELGFKTAMEESKQVKDLGKGYNIAPPPEVLRTMASRYTKILRNRLVTNLGEYRTSQRGTEVQLSEDVWNNEEYSKQVQNRPADGMMNRLENQMPLDPETESVSLEERLANAEKLKEASVRMPNAQIVGDQVAAGSPNDEGYDAAANRLNIALIDRVGIDPNQLEKPGDVEFTNKDLAPTVGEYNENGQRNLVNAKNVEQLESYNEQLRASARGMAEAAAKFPGSTPYTEDMIQKTLSYQIAPGTKNAVVINGRTKAMDEDLMGTQVPRVGLPEGQTIERNLEVKPSQLTFSASQ